MNNFFSILLGSPDLLKQIRQTSYWRRGPPLSQAPLPSANDWHDHVYIWLFLVEPPLTLSLSTATFLTSIIIPNFLPHYKKRT